jgi:hypothetical protein
MQDDERQARLGRALKANMGRRKAQARARTADARVAVDADGPAGAGAPAPGEDGGPARTDGREA